MADYKVTCINKPNRNSPHEAITFLGGPGWYHTRQEVVDAINSRYHRFYTDNGGKVAWLDVRKSQSGDLYVQTKADGVWQNNLLELPECG